MEGSKSSVFPKSLHHVLWFQSGYVHYGLRCFIRSATSLGALRFAVFRKTSGVNYAPSLSIFTNFFRGNRRRRLPHSSAKPSREKIVSPFFHAHSRSFVPKSQPRQALLAFFQRKTRLHESGSIPRRCAAASSGSS